MDAVHSDFCLFALCACISIYACILDPWATNSKQLTVREFYIVCAGKWLVGSSGEPSFGDNSPRDGLSSGGGGGGGWTWGGVRVGDVLSVEHGVRATSNVEVQWHMGHSVAYCLHICHVFAMRFMLGAHIHAFIAF